MIRATITIELVDDVPTPRHTAARGPSRSAGSARVVLNQEYDAAGEMIGRLPRLASVAAEQAIAGLRPPESARAPAAA